MTKFELMKKLQEERYEILRNFSRRLYSCSASMFFVNDFSFTETAEPKDFIILCSYSTFTAIFCVQTETLYCLDYYSITTSQHFRKFEKWLKDNGYYPDEVTFLYKRSDRIICEWQGQNIKIKKEDIETDFAEWLDLSFEK